VIETEQSICIAAPIDRVWDYVQDIRRWANLFPGCQECAVQDEHDSRWTLKVGAGGLVRTVTALVHVNEWAGPERVSFSFKLQGDPVEGSGAFIAQRKRPGETEVRLKVRVAGSGALAPMWEAMSRPLLPRLARSFGEQLKAEIEKGGAEAVPVVEAADAQPEDRRVLGRLKRFWNGERS
jgi:carbon monoxide dehydrogenase subunit G